jgi:hypothetical protein
VFAKPGWQPTKTLLRANKRVVWGDQNWDEMQNCFIGVLIDPTIDPRTLFKPSGPSLLPRGDSGPTLSALLLPGIRDAR